jgi:hypothetical protein
MNDVGSNAKGDDQVPPVHLAANVKNLRSYATTSLFFFDEKIYYIYMLISRIHITFSLWVILQFISFTMIDVRR